jgi:putative transposase
MPFKNRKYTRLKNRELYSTPGTIAHIIIGTQNKIPYFKNQDAAGNITQLIIQTAEERNIKLCAYCVMPDHIHLLFTPSNNCSVTDFVRIIKGRFSACCRNACWDIRLQRSFYDHLL